MPATDKTLQREALSPQTNGITVEGAAAIADGLNAVIADLFAL